MEFLVDQHSNCNKLFVSVWFCAKMFYEKLWKNNCHKPTFLWKFGSWVYGFFGNSSSPAISNTHREGQRENSSLTLSNSIKLTGLFPCISPSTWIWVLGLFPGNDMAHSASDWLPLLVWLVRFQHKNQNIRIRIRVWGHTYLFWPCR